MIRKIFRTGNSMVVSLPKEILDALELAEGGEVSVELDTEQGRIVIVPTIAEADGVDPIFAKHVADFIEQYRPALESLAK
jgi:putative addiction module antidote